MNDASIERSAGYAYFCEKFDVIGIPNWHTSTISNSSVQKTSASNGLVHQWYRCEYWPGEGVGEQLEFALKYDGVNLQLLHQIFCKVPQKCIVDFVRSRPTGRYARRIWFFYEFITRRELPLEDAKTGNYIDALEPEKYYTIPDGTRSKRHRVVNNLPGTGEFCPIIRRTDKLIQYEALDIRKKCEAIIASYEAVILNRALGYLYSKETKSSFEIEHEKVTGARSAKFLSALAMAEKTDFCSKKGLIQLQNLIVDPRFRDTDYRGSQNYVGQTVSFKNEIIHYISPKPDDLKDLMDGLIAAHDRMKSSGMPPVVHCAAIAYGFVFLHPFEDGNGRIHRFLIHNILFQRGIVPSGVMFPVSAVMLKHRARYDASLEEYSRKIMQVIDYDLNEAGEMKVDGTTFPYYRFIDMTAQAEALFEFVISTIEDELEDELLFLKNYDSAKVAIQNIVDMPDKLIDLFIRLALQNNGRLSNGKRKTHFRFLTDEEVELLTEVLNEAYEND